MDEVAQAYTDPLTFLMTLSPQGGIFTLLERRKSFASNRLHLREAGAVSRQNPNRRDPCANCPCLSPDPLA